HRDEQHFGRGNERLIGIAIDHCPEQGSENEESADHSKNDGGVGEEEHFDENEGNAEHKKYRGFPPCQTGQVMAEEKEDETNPGNNTRQRRPRNFKNEIGANDSKEQEQRRQRRKPKRELI